MQETFYDVCKNLILKDTDIYELNKPEGTATVLHALAQTCMALTET